MRFTDKGIAALKSKAERYEVWESNRTGLGGRVSPAGRKSWIYMYRFDGRPRRMTLGSYPAMGLANARQDNDRNICRNSDLARDIDGIAVWQQAIQKHQIDIFVL